MNGIFKVKRKLHFLINSLFYIIFFIAGFIVGGGKFEEINNIINSWLS